MSQLILPPDSAIYRSFGELIKRADMVFFAGLPGVGKSLLLGQLALMATEAGRPLQLLQWDVARLPFETGRYPLQDGVTHPMVIRATGLWLRSALLEWSARDRPTAAMLIGEVPLVGGRLLEIARPLPDEAEALLRDRRTQFLVPTPSQSLRALIESKREESIAAPQHEHEAHDAPPTVLTASWQAVFQVAVDLGLAGADAADRSYSPEIYAAVYRHLLRHRNARVLKIEEALQPRGSVYDFSDRLPNLKATAAQAAAAFARLEAEQSVAEVAAAAERWYAF